MLAAIGLAACGVEKSSNPLSPQIAGPIAGVTITAPSAAGPASGSQILVGSQPVEFVVDPATSDNPRPFWYELDVATDANFSNLVYSEPTLTAAESVPTTHRLLQTLDAGQMYYWRVRAVDGANTGPYSAAASFEITIPVVIGTPAPQSPTGGATQASTTVELVASNAAVSGPVGTLEYVFDVSLARDFSSLVASVRVTPDASGTTRATVAGLAEATLFFWRVGATDSTVAGAWSGEHTTLTTQRIRRGTFENVRALELAIEQYLAHYNEHCKPFVWTATADAILEKVTRFCERTSETGH